MSQEVASISDFESQLVLYVQRDELKLIINLVKRDFWNATEPRHIIYYREEFFV